MINRLEPAGIGLAFCAKAKALPGEISRVKSHDEKLPDSLVRTPIVDTFTASHSKSVNPDIQKEQLPRVSENNKSDRNTKKGNA